MAQCRVVVVKGTHQYSQSDLRTFVTYLKSPSPTASLVFIAEGLAKESLREEAKDGAFHLYHPSQGEIPRWITRIAKELGKEISPEAVEYLQEVIGRDLQGLHNELFKASLYIGDKKRMEASDAEGVVSELKATTIFELTKAVGDRNLARALRILGKLWESGEHHLKILGMIVRQFRHLLMAKEILDGGGGHNDLKKSLGVTNPYYLRELSAQARSFSQSSLQRALLNLWKADMSFKRSSVSRRLLLEELIIRLCRSS